MPSRSRNRGDEPDATAEDAVMEDATAAQYQPVVEEAEDAQDGENGENQEDEQMAEDEEDDEEDEPIRVKLLPGSTPTAASFEFLEEGHTLGNALRYIIMKNPDVEFCAYAIPHPSEAKMNIRIQTYEGTTAIEALEKGLRDVQDLCDVVAEKFWAAKDEVPKIPAPSYKVLESDDETDN